VFLVSFIAIPFKGEMSLSSERKTIT